MADLEHINLHIEQTGEQYDLTPHNSRLFTFAGHAVLENGDTIDISSRDHVYHIIDMGQEDQRGMYIFDPETVRQLGAMMLRNHFPASLFNRTVPEGDEQAYQQYLTQRDDEIGDFVPGNWS